MLRCTHIACLSVYYLRKNLKYKRLKHVSNGLLSMLFLRKYVACNTAKYSDNIRLFFSPSSSAENRPQTAVLLACLLETTKEQNKYHFQLPVLPCKLDGRVSQYHCSYGNGIRGTAIAVNARCSRRCLPFNIKIYNLLTNNTRKLMRAEINQSVQ